MIPILIDTASLPETPPGLTSVFLSWLGELDAEFDYTILDRGMLPDIIPGRGRVIPFPAHSETGSAAESILIQKIIEQVGAKLFVTTGNGTPLNCPTILLTHQVEPRGLSLASRYARAIVRLVEDHQPLAGGELPRDQFCQVARRIIAHSASGKDERFYEEWERLRRLQYETED